MRRLKFGNARWASFIQRVSSAVLTFVFPSFTESMNYPLSSPLAVSIAHGYDLLRLMARSSLGACAFVDEVIRYH